MSEFRSIIVFWLNQARITLYYVFFGPHSWPKKSIDTSIPRTYFCNERVHICFRRQTQFWKGSHGSHLFLVGDDCLDNRGNTRAHGSGWPLDDCTTCECLYGKLNCTSEACPQLECLSDETLVIEPGICCPNCVKQPAICKVYGDPHYRTFDGETIHFQGMSVIHVAMLCPFIEWNRIVAVCGLLVRVHFHTIFAPNFSYNYKYFCSLKLACSNFATRIYF